MPGGGSRPAETALNRILHVCLFAALLGGGLSSTRADSPWLRLNAGDVDTRDPAWQARAARTPADPGRRLFFVQWSGPVQPAWREALETAGLQIVDYIPDHAYLVYGEARAIAAFRRDASARKAVRTVAAAEAADKLHAALAKRRARAGATDPDASWVTIQLVKDDQANAVTLGLIESLAQAPVRGPQAMRHYVNVAAALPEDALAGLAAQPDVISIAPYAVPRKYDERQAQIVAGNISGNAPSGPGYLAWLNSRGFSQEQFSASGFVVNISDSGIDAGTTHPRHFGLYTGGDTALASRVAYARLEGTPNVNSTLQGCDGHGTLNAHILAGYNDRTDAPHADSAGFRYGLGIAPFVRVGSSVIFDSLDFTSPDYRSLMSRAYADGARISSDSWGADVFGIYDVDAQTYDALVRDAQPAGAAVAAPGNQQMIVVFAAGNAGPGIQTIGSPGTAKNVITVGASENVHSHAPTNGGTQVSGADGCQSDDTDADSLHDIADFSSRGPTSDQRSKPELVAPGTHITGGVGQQVKAMTGTGSNLACFTANGICALPGRGQPGNTNNFFPQGQRWYSTSSGTSHATPAVAGAAALVYQHFLNSGRNAPSPAMVKAYLVNTARYLTGTYANDTLWSNDQGMGGLDLGRAFDDTPRFLRNQVSAEKFTASGQERIYMLDVADTGRPVRVTLSWTDAPGSTIGAPYKNDLNLTVTANGETYRGNLFDGAWSISGGSADTRNNTESVFLPAGITGTVTITVTGFNINSDGVPNASPLLDQDFALVGYNLLGETTANLEIESVAIAAENCVPGNTTLDPGETVTLSLVLRNVGSIATTNLVATLLEGGGVSNPGPPAVYGMIPPDYGLATNTFTFTAHGACGDHVTTTFQLMDGTNLLGSVLHVFPLGGAVSTTTTNVQPEQIDILDLSNADPYPSTLVVSGVVGTVRKVTATLRGLTHGFMYDIDALLVAPDGQAVVLMSACVWNTVTDTTITFDDDAPGYLPPGFATLASGSYRPTRWLDPVFGSPAPAGPYGTVMADFTNSNPNGEWKLFVVDMVDDDAGQIAMGWRLDITVGQPVCCTDFPDTDSDGMPDAWELEQFGNLVVAGASTDFDLDFVLDRHEYVAGTQPTNEQSFLYVAIDTNEVAGEVVLTWPGITGKTYAVGRTTNLLAGFMDLATNLPGISPLNTYTDGAPPAAGSHYRIRLAP